MAINYAWSIKMAAKYGPLAQVRVGLERPCLLKFWNYLGQARTVCFVGGLRFDGCKFAHYLWVFLTEKSKTILCDKVKLVDLIQGSNVPRLSYIQGIGILVVQ